MIKKILLLFFTVIPFISCNNTTHGECGSAWIGGEVVNPKNDYVLISQSRKIIDTIFLNKDNKFLYKLESIDPGIYYFSHNEYQTLYLEPGDSLMLRVNTVEFDESLSYTGKGANRNNLLMDFFLLNEEERALMSQFYVLAPEAFEEKIDSMKQHRMSIYNRFASNNSTSKDFKQVALASRDYDIYGKKEWYLTVNALKRTYNESNPIPESFYDYRKNIELDNEHLTGHYSYRRFLNFYFDNLAYEKYKDKEPYNRNSFTHSFIKNQLIDSLIYVDSLKNGMLRANVRHYLLNAKNEEHEKSIVTQFNDFSTHDKDKAEIAKLMNATINLTPGHVIPNLKLLTPENTVKDLHSTFSRATVIYFWSSKSVKHYKNIHARANELRQKFPEFNFIAINVDSHFKKWLKVVQSSGYTQGEEYQFEDINHAETKLVINSVNKAMVVDDEGKILNGHTNIFDRGIENELLGYLNQ